jgi:hypothetical protein
MAVLSSFYTMRGGKEGGCGNIHFNGTIDFPSPWFGLSTLERERGEEADCMTFFCFTLFFVFLFFNTQMQNMRLPDRRGEKDPSFFFSPRSRVCT